jgi:hypothetical protein
MIYTTGANRTHHTHALSSALAIAKLAGWQFTERPERFAQQLADTLYDPVADLVLVPWAEGTAFGTVAQVIGEIRSSAVMVMPGRTTKGEVTFYVSIARCARGQIHWHHGLRVWIGERDDAWLVPDPDGDDLEGACFPLTRAPLRPAGRPWSHPQMHRFGFSNADMQLRELIAPR